MTALACPACPGTRAPRQYLCPSCWAQLPDVARRQLARRDARALARLRQLHDQLTAGIPPHAIRIEAP